MSGGESTYEILEGLYAEYNRREYVSPDPLEFLYRYDSLVDREVVGLVASSLAYGRVGAILASVERVLALLGRSPADTLAASCGAEGRRRLFTRLDGFAHRFTKGRELSSFLCGIGSVLREYGSLENLFRSGCLKGREEDKLLRPTEVFAALDRFARTILDRSDLSSSYLLPLPSKGSACKRLCLYLRWMVRRDGVDPGGWRSIRPNELIVPLDVHMFRIVRGLALVTRKSADAPSALAATEGFRRLCPDDPVRYDFVLSRFGIRSELSVDDLLAKFGQFM